MRWIFRPLVNFTESGYLKEVTKDSLTSEDLSFEENVPQPLRCKNGNEKRPPPKHRSRWNHRPPSNRNASFTGNTLNSGTTIKMFSLICVLQQHNKDWYVDAPRLCFFFSLCFADFTCRPADHYNHDNRWDHYHYHHDDRHQQHVMRNRHRKTHYAPYY